MFSSDLKLEHFAKTTKIDIAALTIPKSKAPQVAQDLQKYGVRAIWNFAPTDLNLSKDLIVENVHLAESLMRLSYNLNAAQMNEDN